MAIDERTESRPSIVFCVFVLYFCQILLIEGQNIVYNTGENITFECPHKQRYSPVLWESDLFGSSEYIFQVYPSYDPHLYQRFDPNKYFAEFVDNVGNFNLKFSIHDLTLSDSANYSCIGYVSQSKFVIFSSYQIRVMSCECAYKNLTGQGYNRVICNVNGYETKTRMNFNVSVSSNGNVYYITGRFNKTQLVLNIPSEITTITSIVFNPLSHKNFQRNISCSPPKLPSAVSTTDPDVSLFTVSPLPSSSSPPLSSSNTQSPTEKSYITYTEKGELSEISEIYNNYADENDNSGNELNNNFSFQMILSITVVPGFFLVTLIAAFVIGILICQKKKRQLKRYHMNYRNDLRKKNGKSSEKGISLQSTIPEAGMVENFLYESSDLPSTKECETNDPYYSMPGKPTSSNKIRSMLTTVAECPSSPDDTDMSFLYAVPDKGTKLGSATAARSGTATRKSADTVGQDVRSNSQIASTYEDVDIAPMYAMPDKGYKSDNSNISVSITKSSEANSNVSSLYAMPDKGSKAENKAFGDVAISSLYAVPDKGPKDKDAVAIAGIAMCKPGTADKPGDAGITSLYAVPDKGPKESKEDNIALLYAVPEKGLNI